MKINLQMPEVHDMTADTVDIISTSSVTADLPYDQEDLEKILPYCVWQPIETVRLQGGDEL